MTPRAAEALVGRAHGRTVAGAARSRAVRQLLPARADDALSRQRDRVRVGVAASARAARRLPFRVHAHVPRDADSPDQSFLAFVAVALWPWLAAQEALQRGAVSIAGYAGMIRKVAFPHELVVLASVAATFVLQFAGYVAMLAVLRVVGEPIHLRGLLVAVPVCGRAACRRHRPHALRSRRCRCSSGTSSTC